LGKSPAATGLGLFARGRRRPRARLRWQKGASDAPLAGLHPSCGTDQRGSPLPLARQVGGPATVTRMGRAPGRPAA
jgi:hypothetical protein